MTRLYNNVVSRRLRRIKNKTQYLRQNLLSMLCIFLIGFLSGNLFGTILNNLRNWVRWDGFIIFGLIAKIEAISYFSYKSTDWSCVCVTFNEALASVAYKSKQAKLDFVPLPLPVQIFDLFGHGLQIKDLHVPRICIPTVKHRLALRSDTPLCFVICPDAWARAWRTRRFAKFHSNPFEKKRILRQKSYQFGRAFWNNLNLFKIGIMVGFFVDAFKVGS